MPQCIAHRHKIKRRVRKRQLLAAPLEQSHRISRAVLRQHSLAGIHATDVSRRQAEFERSLDHKARASGDVEQLHTGFQSRAAQRLAAVGAIRPE